MNKTDYDEAYQIADKKMYEAKKCGKNIICGSAKYLRDDGDSLIT